MTHKEAKYITRIVLLCFHPYCMILSPITLTIPSRVYQLTHSQENVLDLQWLESSEMNPDEMEDIARTMATHLQHLLDQRDTHLEVPIFEVFSFFFF